jgi:diguanylate cyclase (GGDEF)-like protein
MPDAPARQLWIGLLATLLMGLGVVLAVRALGLDSETHERYEAALALSQAALETQHASGDLRAWQARNTRASSREGDAPIAPAELQALAEVATELRGRIDRLADMPPSGERKLKFQELRATLQRLERIGRNGIAVGETGMPMSRAALVSLGSEFESFEHSLAELVAETHARATAIAQQAEVLKSTARVGLIAFSAVTLMLALLLMVLTLRTLRANKRLLDRMSRLAQQDGLTGIANRRTLDEVVPVEFARGKRSGHALTLVMLDLDHFKRYNDRRGHAAGDALLRGAAQAWQKQMRPTDLLARYGGEEFTLVLPSCDSDQAAQLVDRLRPLVPDRQTFSAGIATWDGDETAGELLQRADRALRMAKKGGRNRTMIAGREAQATLPLGAAPAS